MINGQFDCQGMNEVALSILLLLWALPILWMLSAAGVDGACCLQVSLCINAIRSNPDAFACQYPCNYTEWRASVVNPPRGTLTSSGTNGSVELTK